MKKQWLWLVVMTLLVATLGCLGSGTETPATVEPTDAPPTREATPLPTTGDGFTLTVDNRSHYDVCYVYISASDSDSWGEDWLDADIISSDSTYTFDVPAGEYDIMLTDCADTTLATEWDVSQNYTLRVGGANQAAVTVYNDADTSICYMLISPSSQSTWGDDMLGAKEVVSSGRDRIFFVSPGTYDIKAMDCEENTLGEQYEVEIQQDFSWSPSAGSSDPAPTGPTGNQITFTVDNPTDDDVCWLYVSPADSGNWGDDQLESSIIWAGETYDVYLDPGTYDIKVEFCGGVDPVETYAVSIASDMTWAVAEDTGPKTTLTVINESSEDICFLYVSLSTASDWGSDRLGLDILDAGESYTVRVTPGTYDLKAEFCGATDALEESNVDLSIDTTWTIND